MAAFLTAVAFSGPFARAQSGSSDTVGFPRKSLVLGFNLVGLTVHSPVRASGVIDAVAGKVVTDNQVNFGAALTPGRKYILEVLTGAAEGAIQEVDSFAGNTVTTGDDISSELAAGDRYELRAAATLETALGTTTSVLTKNFFATGADKVWLPNGAGGYTRYFQRSDGAWRNASTTALTPNVPIVYADGFFIEKVGATPVDLVVYGEVKTIDSASVITTGFNLVGGIYPSGSTVQNSGLGNFLKKAFFPGTADKIWISNGSGGYDRYYFRTPTDLRNAGAGTPAVTTPLNLPSSFFIEKPAGGISPANYTITPPPAYGNL